jgi:hypothetical protein
MKQKITNDLLNKMFETQGVTLDKVKKQRDWRKLYSWSEKDEKSFRKWATRYLMYHLEIPEETAKFEVLKFIVKFGLEIKSVEPCIN